MCHRASRASSGDKGPTERTGAEESRSARETHASPAFGHAPDFLVEATRHFARSLDHEQTLRTLARMAIPRLADFCAVHLVREDGRLEVAAVAHSVAEKEQLAWSIARRWPVHSRSSSILHEVLGTGQSKLIDDFPEQAVSEAAADEDHEQALSMLGIRSVVIVPLSGNDRCFGTVSFVSAESQRSYDAEDLRFTESFANHAGLALDNALLFRQAAEARAMAERAETRMRLLYEIGDLLARHMEPESALRQLAAWAVDTVADYCVTYACDGTQIRRVGFAHHDPTRVHLVEALDRSGPLRLDDEVGAGRVVRTGEVLFVREVSDEMISASSSDKHYVRIIRELGPRSTVVVPLRARGRTVGAAALAFTAHSGRRYNEEDVQFVRDLADRAGLLIDNATLYREAKAALELRDEVVAIVSHDLRSPLNTVVTACEILKHDPSPPVRERSLATIGRAAGQMRRLAQDLLDFSRMKAGTWSVQPKATDLTPLFLEARDMFSARAAERAIQLDVDLPRDLPYVSADRDRIFQVLTNLLDNACRHVQVRGRVGLRAEVQDDLVVISVSDDGPGISKDAQARVFERYWRPKGTGGKGAGLGLAICKGIVEAHGGSISVESERGAGAIFRFSVPLCHPERSQSTRPSGVVEVQEDPIFEESERASQA